MDDILKAISEYYGIPVSNIANKGRKADNVKARQIYFYLCRLYYPERSLTSYAVNLYHLGDTLYDHTTVLHSIKLISNLLERYRPLQKEINDLNAKLNSAHYRSDVLVKEVNLLALCDHVIPSEKKYL